MTLEMAVWLALIQPIPFIVGNDGVSQAHILSRDVGYYDHLVTLIFH
jgi:hypothetical protein